MAELLEVCECGPISVSFSKGGRGTLFIPIPVAQYVDGIVREHAFEHHCLEHNFVLAAKLKEVDEQAYMSENEHVA